MIIKASEITRPKIVVFGLYKTGTTALFSNIKNSLHYTPRLLFESKDYQARDEDQLSGVLAKVILGANDTNYESFSNFDKRILIIRDPRDWIISSCLFIIQEIHNIYQNPAVRAEVLALLRKKERDPKGLPFCHILEFVLSHTSLANLAGFGEWAENLHRDFISRAQSELCEFALYYEDFVDRKIGALAQYLDVEITDDLTLDKSHAHVPRTKGYGNWKDWFTQQDVMKFKPLFQDYILNFGYDPAWILNTIPQIRPENCSKYVERVVNLKLKL